MYQTRSEILGIAEWDSLEGALFYAEEHLTVWKISFFAENGERIRLVKNNDSKFELERMEDAIKEVVGEES